MNKIMSRTSLISLILLLTISVSCQNFFWSHTKQEEGIYTANFGLLYNYWAMADSRNMIAVGWHIPTQSELQSLVTYIGSSNGGKLKETGTTYWNSPNTGATNEYGFNARASGERNASGVFGALLGWCKISSSTLVTSPQNCSYLLLQYNTSTGMVAQSSSTSGRSVRPVKDSTTLSNGQSGTYTGNDGKVYRTICINGVEYLADNLCETRFRNGDVIPWYGANPVNFFTNAEWAALTTAGVCAYSNNVNNVAAGFSFPTP